MAEQITTTVVLVKGTLRAASRTIGSSTFRRGAVCTAREGTPTADLLLKDPAWITTKVSRVVTLHPETEAQATALREEQAPAVVAAFHALRNRLTEQAAQVDALPLPLRKAYVRIVHRAGSVLEPLLDRAFASAELRQLLDDDELDEHAGEPEAEAVARYEEAQASGLSDAEAREDGWPTATDPASLPFDPLADELDEHADPVVELDASPELEELAAVLADPGATRAALVSAGQAAGCDDCEDAWLRPTSRGGLRVAEIRDRLTTWAKARA